MSLLAFNLTGSPVTLTGISPSVIIPASATPPNPGAPVNVTAELRGLSGGQYAALNTQAAATLQYAWSTGVAEYPTSGLTLSSSGGVSSGTQSFDGDKTFTGILKLPTANAPLATPAPGVFTTATTGGTLVPGTYYYRIFAANSIGKTTASTEQSIVVPPGTNTNTVTVNWGAVTGATGYYVMGRGALLGTGAGVIAGPVAGLSFLDDGTSVPATIAGGGGAPTSNTTYGAMFISGTLVSTLHASGTTGIQFHQTAASSPCIANDGTMEIFAQAGDPSGSIPDFLFSCRNTRVAGPILSVYNNENPVFQVDPHGGITTGLDGNGGPINIGAPGATQAADTVASSGYLRRMTGSAGAGGPAFLDFQNAGTAVTSGDYYQWYNRSTSVICSLSWDGKFDGTGIKLGGHLAISGTAPTVTGFGSSPSVVVSNGTAAFTINVGTGGVASTGTINFPTAPNGWVVYCQNETHPDTSITSQTGGTNNTATVKNYSRTTGSATAWAAADVLRCIAIAY